MINANVKGINKKNESKWKEKGMGVSEVSPRCRRGEAKGKKYYRTFNEGMRVKQT